MQGVLSYISEPFNFLKSMALAYTYYKVKNSEKHQSKFGEERESTELQLFEG